MNFGTVDLNNENINNENLNKRLEENRQSKKSNMYNVSQQNIHIKSIYALTNSDVNNIISGIKAPVNYRLREYGGRGAITKIKLSFCDSVVIKHYVRGGLLRIVNKNLYLNFNNVYRSEQEFEILNRVLSLGVLVPEPVAFVYTGKHVYRAWLLTKEIPHDMTLSQYSVENESKIFSLIKELAFYLEKLIDNKIFHVDFHPGNVLVDKQNKLHFVDFDKAKYFDGSKSQLRELYLKRWRRAVIKHGLPESLTEYLCSHLCKSF